MERKSPGARAATLMLGITVLLGSACNCQNSHLVGSQGMLQARVADDVAFAAALSLDLGLAGPRQRLRLKVMLSNRGAAPIRLGALQVVEGASIRQGFDPDAEHPFALDYPAGAVLKPTEEVPATLSFEWGEQGLTADREFGSTVLVLVPDAAPENSLKLQLRARVVPCARVVPEQINFGRVLVGQRVEQVVRVENPASVEAAVSLEVSPAEAFGLEADAPVTVPAGGASELRMSFQPQSAGHYESVLKLSVGKGCPLVQVELKGEGLDQLVVISPEQVDCGWVLPGEAASAELTLENRGQVAVTIGQPVIAPVNEETQPDEFVVVAEEWESGQGELAPGALAKRLIRCLPTSGGLKEATLSFAIAGDARSQGSVGLQAVAGGPRIEVAPRELDFGKVAWVQDAELSKTRTLIVGNVGSAPAGQAPGAALRLGTDLGTGGTGAPYYRVVAENDETSAEEFEVSIPPAALDGWPILPGGSVELAVRVVPRSAGPKQATLILFSNAAKQPETTVRLYADSTEMLACEYRLSASNLEYGIVHANKPRVLEVALENVGREACLIYGYELSQGEEGVWSLVEPFDFKLVPAGERFAMAVRLAPKAVPPDWDYEPYDASLTLQVSSPGAPESRVSLRGGVGPACIAWLPEEVDFGTLQPGEESIEASPQLANMCGQVLTLTRVDLVGGAGAFELSLETPIPPGGLAILRDSKQDRPANGPWLQTHPFAVRFKPSVPGVPGNYQATVVVDLVREGRALRYVVPVRGQSRSAGKTVASFVQGGGDPVDILWFHTSLGEYVDDQALVAAMTAVLSEFTSHLSRSGNDFHLGVMGCHNNAAGWPNVLDTAPWAPEPFLTPTTPDFANKLYLKLRRGTINGVVQPSYCQPSFRGNLGAFYMLHMLTNSVGKNAGFHRDNARLALISTNTLSDFYTDLHVGAPNYWCDDDPACLVTNFGEHISAFSAFTESPRAGKLNFAALAKPPGEQDIYPPSDRFVLGPRVMASATNGAWTWFTAADEETWRRRVAMLAEVATGLRLLFYLPSPPELTRGEVEVSVNGVRVPATSGSATAWKYETEENAVRFTLDASPLPGQRVDIAYYTQPQ